MKLQKAAVIGWGDRIGSLGVNMCADITVLSLRDVDDFELEDRLVFNGRIQISY